MATSPPRDAAMDGRKQESALKYCAPTVFVCTPRAQLGEQVLGLPQLDVVGYLVACRITAFCTRQRLSALCRPRCLGPTCSARREHWEPGYCPDTLRPHP